MNRQVSSISTDQVRAFVELVHSGSLRLAAQNLHLSEEGLRSRLLMLEERLGATLYEKERGRRGDLNLTRAGRIFHIKALQFLEQAKTLTEIFEPSQPEREIRIAVSDYMANYYLGDILKRFHETFPHVTVQVATGTAKQVASAMQADPTIQAGICCCDDFPKNLRYQQLLSFDWYYVAPLDNHRSGKSAVSLEELSREPLIMYEPGVPGRQRILEAFYSKHLTPRIAIEVPTTQMILSLIENGVGASIIPLTRHSTILRGRQIGQVAISDAIRSVECWILSRSDVEGNPVVREFIGFMLDQFAHKYPSDNAPN